jgi:hypothetical protein
MSRPIAVNANGESADRLVLDAGVVYVGFSSPSSLGTVLGCTRDGSIFTVEPTMREMPVDGAKGAVKGWDRITRVNAKMSLNMLEWSAELIKKAIPGASSATSSDHLKITRALALAATDYTDAVAIVAKVSGSEDYVIVVIKNAINTGNFELGTKDEDEAVNKLELRASFDPDALDTEPWEIYWPSDVEPTTAGA